MEAGLNQRALVIAPLAVMPSWVEHVREHTSVRPYMLRGTPVQRRRTLEKVRAHTAPLVLVVNYDLLHTHLEDLLAANFDYIVADESQRLINTRNRWTKAAFKLADAAKTKRILTGTPVRNTELDLYGQMRFLSRSILPWRTYFAFKKRFAVEVPVGYGLTKVVGVREPEIIHTHCSPFVDVVRMDDVLPDLPKWVVQERVVAMLPEQRRVYRELARELLAQVNGETITAQTAAVEALRLAQVAGGTIKAPSGDTHILGSKKLDEVRDVLDNTHGGVVIWCRFRAEIEWLAKELDAPFIHGGVSSHERHARLQAFEKGDARVIICQIQAVGEGVNELANADAEIRWSYDFSYAMFEQSRARMRRKNRTNPLPCLSVMLMTEGTVEAATVEALRNKQSVATRTLDDIRKLIL